MNSKRFSAGSQRRRRGRTALIRSWLSALDNQRTEGRAPLIRVEARHRGGTLWGPRDLNVSLYCHVCPRQGSGVISFIPKLASVNCIIINIPGLLFTVHDKILLFKSINFL